MPGVDRSSFGFSVIVIANSQEIRVSGHPDERTAGQVLDNMTEVSARVLKFQYEDSEREQDQLKLTVDNHDLYFFDHPAWEKGNLVRFLFGYPGAIFGPRYAIVDSMRGFLTLDIVCVEESALANEQKARKFENMTRCDVVRAIVGEGALQGVVNVDLDETSLADEKPQEWQQAGQTDWQFLLKLAEKPGYEVYIEDDTLHFHPRRLAKPPLRKLTYFYGDGDLMEFSVESLRTADRAAVTEVRGRDPIARTDVAAVGSNETTTRDVLGNQGSLVIERNRTTGTLVAGRKILTTADPEPNKVQDEADTHFRQSEQDEVEASATIVGDPYLPAKSVVQIEGVSRMLSGNYYVTKATHVMDGTTGYRTTLSLMKNALTAVPTSDPPTLDPSMAAENRQKVTDSRVKRIVRDPLTGSLRQE